VGSNIIGVISGVQRTLGRQLILLLGIGIAIRLALFWWLARVFEAPLVDFLGWLQRYQWWVVGGSIALVFLVNGRNFSRGAKR
jgi:hypothetical protein